MNRSAQLTAAEVVNSYQPERLKEILEQYGEVPNAKRVVGVICRERGRKPIETVQQLRDLVSPLFPAKTLNKELSKLFQAIRIEVNREIESLQNDRSGSRCVGSRRTICSDIVPFAGG